MGYDDMGWVFFFRVLYRRQNLNEHLSSYRSSHEIDLLPSEGNHSSLVACRI